MELINGVLQSLSIDQTIFYQLGIFICIFLALDVIVLRRLQEILELRENKTVKLEKKAEEKLANAENIAVSYRKRIEEAKTNGQKVYDDYKKEIIENRQIQLKRAEEEIDQEFERQKKRFKAESISQREHLLKNTDTLSQKLMEKLTS